MVPRGQLSTDAGTVAGLAWAGEGGASLPWYWYCSWIGLGCGEAGQLIPGNGTSTVAGSLAWGCPRICGVPSKDDTPKTVLGMEFSIM